MATSERILDSIVSAAEAQRVASAGYHLPRRPVWRQATMDFIAIAGVLGLTSGLLGGYLAQAPVSPIAAALMVVTIFGFSGTYRRNRTPLNIADTAGLLRGISCATVLLAIASIAGLTIPTASALVTGIIVISFLVLERECAYILTQQKLLSGDYAAPALSYELAALGQPQPQYGDFLLPSYDRDGVAYLLKRIVDVVGAGILLLLALPLLIAVAVLIKLDSRGPALIRQRRIGKGGVPFSMWKFRSMHVHVERYARSPVSDRDPRLTRFGRALRRFSIDELPQLLNVLRGDMSLVGPRPEMPFIVKRYDGRERLRLNAIPGITGLWQISPARALPIHEHLELDLFYIHNQDFFLDAAILLRTVTAVFRGIGAT